MSTTLCPTAGGGVHTWLLGEANRCRIAGLTPEQAANRLRVASALCGRTVKGREILDAVSKAFSSSWQPGHSCREWMRPAPAWPRVSRKRIAAIVATGNGLAQLRESSPIRFTDDEPHAEEIVTALYPADSLLCCGRDNWNFDTKPIGEWRGQLADLQLIVPSPMSAPTGRTKDGKESKHSLDNTGPRRFLVVEFDRGETDQHAAILMHLAQFAPMVCAVHSGGKSLHGWFFVASSPPEKVSSFFRYAVGLGADPMLWTRSQFCRMPDGTRSNGKRQAVHFFNTKPLPSHE